MLNLISNTEAFQAMLAGKQILCRDSTSTLLKEFRPISEFSADIFTRSNTEFTIEIEMIELAGCRFPKPLFISDIQVGQEIFIVMPSCILRTKFDADNKDVNTAIMHGFAQSDADSAIDQARAMSLVLGFDLERSSFDSIQDGFAEKPIKQRKKPTKTETDDRKPSEEISDDIVEPSSVATDNAASKQFDVTEAHTEVSQKLKDQYMSQLTGAVCMQDVETCETEINSNTQLIENHRYHLATFVSSRKAVFELKEYQQKLSDLIQRVQDSQTIEEVNAVTRYTKDWTEKQRAPLIAAQSKRLGELDQRNYTNPPSLLADIQNASTAEVLDGLEAAALQRNPEVVPTLLNEIKKKRAFLNSQQGGTAA